MPVCLDFKQEKVGKTIESSKIRYTWTLVMDGQQHEIVMTNTKGSGKKRILVDGYLQHEQQVLVCVCVQKNAALKNAALDGQ